MQPSPTTQKKAVKNYTYVRYGTSWFLREVGLCCLIGSSPQSSVFKNQKIEMAVTKNEFRGLRSTPLIFSLDLLDLSVLTECLFVVALGFDLRADTTLPMPWPWLCSAVAVAATAAAVVGRVRAYDVPLNTHKIDFWDTNQVGVGCTRTE